MFGAALVLQVKRYNPAGTKNARGNAVPGYAEPYDWPVQLVVPGSMEEPGESNRDLSLIAYTILAPDNELVPGERDVVVLQGDDYEVNGRPAHWAIGAPWYEGAPATVELKRAEG